MTKLTIRSRGIFWSVILLLALARWRYGPISNIQPGIILSNLKWLASAELSKVYCFPDSLMEKIAPSVHQKTMETESMY